MAGKKTTKSVAKKAKKPPSGAIVQQPVAQLEGHGTSRATLRSQIVISKKGRGGQRYAHYAFTEHGAIMAASILVVHVPLQVREGARSTPLWPRT